MGKPTSQQLQQALDEAARMREQDEDPDYLAKSLLNLHYRIGFLEKVMFAAELYLRGEGGHEHAELKKAIETAKKEEAHTAGSDSKSLYL